MGAVAGNERGFSLLELLVVLCLFGVLLLMATFAFARMVSRVALRTAALRVIEPMIDVRERALAMDREYGVKFRNDGSRWSYSIHVDGNGNGIRNAEILSGVDPLEEGPTFMFGSRPMATIQLPPEGTKDPDSGGNIDASASPVQFNRSTICSCSRTGDCTPGSVFLTTSDGQAAFVRSSGELGRMRIAYYDPLRRKWE